MLRITIHDSPSEFRLHLEGRLTGPWVRELELCYQTAQSTLGGRPVTVDLKDLDFADAAGEQLLFAMYREGAKLVARSPIMRRLVWEIGRESAERDEPGRVL